MTTVVTGIGVLAPNGLGTAAYWHATLAGTSGIGRITRFDPSGYRTQLGGEVPDFDAASRIPSRLLPQTDRWTHLSFVAAEEALADAGVRPAELSTYELGVITSTSSSGGEFGQRELGNLWAKGPRYVSAYQSIAWFYAATTGQLSIRHGLRGPAMSVATEQASGLDAVAHARRVIRSGDARVVVSGGLDAPLTPYALVAQQASGRLSRSLDADRAYLPFDVDADGYVTGEGGAILIVEDAAHARDRGARVYARVAGYAATFDPHRQTNRRSKLDQAVRGALRDAGIGPAEIDVVFADAMGVPEHDREEARVITDIFRAGGVAVTAPKTMTGRLYAGGASLDLVAAALALRDQIIPPTVGVHRPAPWCELDLVRNRPRSVPLHTALVIARGYGGFNSAVVLCADSPAACSDEEDRYADHLHPGLPAMHHA